MKNRLFKYPIGCSVLVNGVKALIVDRIHFGYRDNQYIVRWFLPDGGICAEIVPEDFLVTV